MTNPSNRIAAFALTLAAAVIDLLAIQSAQAGIWVSSGPFTTARYAHTATLLPNGKVLAAGGGYNLGYFSSAELYDPAGRFWIPTGSMTNNRAFHTATLLPNGKVLVAGGLSSAGINNRTINGAELYDPATGKWTRTGSMATARYDDTATLLPNGKVLVAGGVGISSAELYDPATGTWTPAGAMTIERWQHTATLLPNGRVLVVGGVGLSSTELYDPSNNTWTASGSMTQVRRLHTATLFPDGTVLAAGGLDAGSTVYATAETYNPTSGAWKGVGSMALPRFNHSATLLPSGKVLVAGGALGASDIIGRVELYQPNTGTWATNVPMRTPREEHSATLLPDGSLVVAGGRNVNGNSVEATSSTELYIKAPGTVTLGNLLQTYDGTTRSITVTTAPPGLVVDVTYNGSPTAPINAGSYTVIGAINDPDYQGRATNTMVISKAAGTVTLDNLVQTYDGTARSVSFTTMPPGLSVVVTYDGSIDAPTNPGTYTVVGTINDLNYFGSTTNTLLVGIRPGILSQPVSRTNNLGTTAIFEVVADGTPPLVYQWRKNGINWSDTNSSILTLTNVQKTDEGLYSVAITNAFGGVVSEEARLTVNLPPVADASATLGLVISVNGSNAMVVLNGSRSHDPDGDSLQYTWFNSGSTNVLTNGVVAVVTLPLGTNSITLTVSDGLATDSQTLTVEVVTPTLAVTRLLDAAGDATAKKSLLATLRAAIAAFDRSNPTAAINQLQAFQNQVSAQLAPVDPETAQSLREEAQFIIDAITGGSTTPRNVKITMNANGKSHLNFSGVSGQIYIIEASSDLVTWEAIGEAEDQTNGVFTFDDDIIPTAAARYYRVAFPGPLP